jgi:hypothetical protein
MLKIRSEQIRPFEPDAKAAFVNRVMNYLRENHGDALVRLPKGQNSVAELPETILRNLVENGIARGESYGLTWKSSLISFVVLMFIVAPNFDLDEKVAKVLTDENIPADKRVRVITEQMTDEDWEKVAEKYDEKAWQKVVAAVAGGENK